MSKGSLNDVKIAGRLGADPKLENKNGFNWCRVSVATTLSKKTGETWTDETNWLSVLVSGKQAETAAKYLTKGSQAIFDCHLQNKKNAKDGTWSLSIVCDNFTMLGGGEKKAAEPAAAGINQAELDPTQFEDDLPF